MECHGGLCTPIFCRTQHHFLPNLSNFDQAVKFTRGRRRPPCDASKTAHMPAHPGRRLFPSPARLTELRRAHAHWQARNRPPPPRRLAAPRLADPRGTSRPRFTGARPFPAVGGSLGVSRLGPQAGRVPKRGRAPGEAAEFRPRRHAACPPGRAGGARGAAWRQRPARPASPGTPGAPRVRAAPRSTAAARGARALARCSRALEHRGRARRARGAAQRPGVLVILLSFFGYLVMVGKQSIHWTR